MALGGPAYPVVFMQAKHSSVRRRVANIGGTTYTDRAASVAGRVDYWASTYRRCVLIDDGGYEELKNGLNAAAILAQKAAYTAARRATGQYDLIVGTTVTPSTNYWSAGQEAVRVAVNAALLADPQLYGYDLVANTAGHPNLADPANTTYYFDGTHLTAAGAVAYAQALVDSGV